MLNCVVKGPDLLLQKFGVKGSVCQRSAGWQTSSTWRMGRDQGSGGRKRMQRGVTVTSKCALLSWSAWLCNSYYHERKARARCVPAAHILCSVIQFFMSR